MKRCSTQRARVVLVQAFVYRTVAFTVQGFFSPSVLLLDDESVVESVVEDSDELDPAFSAFRFS